MASLRASENIQTPYRDWQGPPWSGPAPSPALFCTALPHSFCRGHTAHLWFREQAQLIPTSPPLPLPGHHMLAPPCPSDLSSYVTCSERLSLTISYGNLSVAIFVFFVPSVHIWNDLLYLLAGSLIRIWTSRQQGLFCLSLYPNLAHGRYSTNICLLIHLSFRIKECYSWRGPGKPCTQVPPAIDEEVHDGQVAQSRSMVGGLNCQAGIPMGSGPRLIPQEEITYHANILQTHSRRASRWALEGH